MEILKAAQNSSMEAKGVYKHPAALALDEDVEFDFVIAAKDLKAALAEVESLPGTTKVVDLQLTDEVTVTLKGPAGVQIVAETPETQTVSAAANTTWIWHVRATEVGKFGLILRVVDNLKVGDQSKTVQAEVYHDTFTVEVSAWKSFKRWASRLNSAWAWLVATIPTAVGGAAWLRVHLRKRRARNSPASGVLPKKRKRKPRRTP